MGGATTALEPATRSPFGIVFRGATLPGSPEPIADQLEPFQRAMLPALTPPAPEKLPPATRSPFGRIAREFTSLFMPSGSSADQLVPFQRAIRLAPTPPAAVKVPPATRSPFGNTLRQSTEPFVPAPSADQEPDAGSSMAT